MDAPAHDLPACDAAVSLAFSVLGKRWNAMIMDALSSGADAFATLRRAVPGISDAMLADRLAELTRHELIRREVSPGPPVVVRYSPTPAGESLIPLLKELGRWADDHLTVAPHEEAGRTERA